MGVTQPKPTAKLLCYNSLVEACSLKVYQKGSLSARTPLCVGNLPMTRITVNRKRLEAQKRDSKKIPWWEAATNWPTAPSSSSCHEHSPTFTLWWLAETCAIIDLHIVIFPPPQCSLKHSSSVDDIKSDQRYWQKRLQLRHSCSGENKMMA